jgi:hypothetical protein
MNKKLLFALASLAIMTLMSVGCVSSDDCAPPRKEEAYASAVAHICDGEIDPDVASMVKAYTPSDGINKIVLFEEDKNGKFNPDERGPQEWYVNWVGDGCGILETKELELVACVLWVESELKDTCKYYGANMTPGGRIETYTVIRQIVLYEASTGEIIGTSPLLYNFPNKCPSEASFHDADDVKYYYGKVEEDEVINFLQPFIEP